MTDHYKTLEVPETASQEEIKKAWRRLTLLYHPDKTGGNPEATEKFRAVSEAYKALETPEKRKEYDMMRANPFFSQQMPMPMNMNHASMDDLFGALFGLNGFNVNGMGPNIRVFHNGVPQNGFGSPFPFVQRPAPINEILEVPIDKILTGTTVPLEIERWILQDGSKIFEKETIYVSVPKGIDDGEILTITNKGNILRDDCKGDIRVHIKMNNPTEFKRFGLDLVLEKTITVKEALTGFNFELKYITGKSYTITNNTGNIICNGYKKVIPNMGFSRDEHNGNLIIVFSVKFPEKLSPEVLAQLKAIEF